MLFLPSVTKSTEVLQVALNSEMNCASQSSTSGKSATDPISPLTFMTSFNKDIQDYLINRPGK